MVLLQRAQDSNPKRQKHAATAASFKTRMAALTTSKNTTEKN
jgi:hypothetical protein